MDNFVITGFDQNYFNIFGISWLASLREFGKYTGPILAVTFDNFPKYLADKLLKENVHLIPSDKKKSRNSILDVFEEILKESANYVYWDIDGYFSNPIEKVFSINSDKLTFTENKNLGFILGNNFAWKEYSKYKKFLNLCNLTPMSNITKYFSNILNFIDNEWNYCEPARLLNSVKDTKFIHFTGQIKNVGTEDILFVNKFPEIDKIWKDKFSNKPILKKKFVVNQ